MPQDKTSKQRTCPVCNGTQTDMLYRPARSPGPVARCKTCAMVYVCQIEDASGLIFDGAVVDEHDAHILVSDNLDDVKGSWEFQGLPGKEAEVPALRDNSQRFLAEVAPFLTNGSSNGCAGRKVLDLGSGWGFFLSVAKEQGWDAYGLEPLPTTAVYARAKFGLNVKTDTLRDDSYPPGFFDLITSFQVFEHLPFPGEELAKLRTMLKPSGLVLIEVPNFDSWTMTLLGAKHRHYVQDHLNLFTGETLITLLKRNGFEALKAWRPTRRMSVRHLISSWTGRFFPKSVEASSALAKRLGLWERTIGINVGDIVAVLGRKC